MPLKNRTFLKFLADNKSDVQIINIHHFSVGCVAGLYSFKSHLLHYVYFFLPSRDIVAEAQLEVKLNGIPEGKVLIVKWRGKPVFVYHR